MKRLRVSIIHAWLNAYRFMPLPKKRPDRRRQSFVGGRFHGVMLGSGTPVLGASLYSALRRGDVTGIERAPGYGSDRAPSDAGATAREAGAGRKLCQGDGLAAASRAECSRAWPREAALCC